MRSGLAMGIKGLAVAAMLALAGPTIAQEAAAEADVAVDAGQPAALPDSVVGYTRMQASPDIGQPISGKMNIPDQVTPVGEQAAGMTHYLINPLIIGITIFVFILLTYVVIRFRSSAQDEPSKTTHNFTIEVVWTLIPALILVVVAFPSLRLLANQYNPPETDLTIKVTGHQWYWSYEYPDYGDLSFDSVLLDEDEAKANGDPYLLDVDNRVVIPAGKKVQFLITAADVIHSWAIPSFWVKMDAVPGKINQAWVQVDRPGVYYGQCSELCGVRHGFMPIAVEVVPEEDFKRWMRMKQIEDGMELAGPGIAVDTGTAAASAAIVITEAATEPVIENEAPAAAPAA